MINHSNDLEDGMVYSFGGNKYGELGLGYQKDEIQPKEIESFKNIKIYDICVGRCHSMVLSSKYHFNSI